MYGYMRALPQYDEPDRRTQREADRDDELRDLRREAEAAFNALLERYGGDRQRMEQLVKDLEGL